MDGTLEKRIALLFGYLIHYLWDTQLVIGSDTASPNLAVNPEKMCSLV
jgi:hypothetical protein